MTAPRAIRVLRVFYHDYVNDVVIASSQPESLLVKRIAPLAEQLLQADDNFIGVVDRNDVILQAYAADEAGQVTLELVYPEAAGCLRLTLPRSDALALLDDLPEQFDEHLLPGAAYVD